MKHDMRPRKPLDDRCLLALLPLHADDVPIGTEVRTNDRCIRAGKQHHHPTQLFQTVRLLRRRPHFRHVDLPRPEHQLRITNAFEASSQRLCSLRSQNLLPLDLLGSSIIRAIYVPCSQSSLWGAMMLQSLSQCSR